jgi:hypothetical protein
MWRLALNTRNVSPDSTRKITHNSTRPLLLLLLLLLLLR